MGEDQANVVKVEFKSGVTLTVYRTATPDKMVIVLRDGEASVHVLCNDEGADYICAAIRLMQKAKRHA